MALAEDMSRDALEALLRFHADNGVDEVLTDAPVDRFQQKPKPEQSKSPPNRPGTQEAPPPPPQSQPIVAPKPAVIPGPSVVEDAQRLANAAQDLDALKAAVQSFEGCNLRNTARNLAFEGGTRGASMMLVGGAASRDDDTNGIPFSGLDGILLRNMFAAIDIDVALQTYHGLSIPWAPPGGGPPTPLHLNIMRPFIERQIELAKPQVLIILGNVAARHLVDEKQTVLKLRGQWFEATIGSWQGPATVMHEPSHLREHPSAKRVTWHDLLALKKRLTGT